MPQTVNASQFLDGPARDLSFDSSEVPEPEPKPLPPTVVEVQKDKSSWLGWSLLFGGAAFVWWMWRKTK